MARRFGQVQGAYTLGYDLINAIKGNANQSLVSKVTDIGIKLEEGRKIRINQKLDFEIGKTGILQFEDVDIQHLQILRKEEELDKDEDEVILVPVILDYIYEDKEV